MELSKDEIKQEVVNAIRACQDILDNYKDMDRDDMAHLAKKAQIALKRVNEDLL